MSILGIPVNLINMPKAVATIMKWAESETVHTVFVREVASLMLAVDNKSLKDLHYKASLIVPDGTPLVWIGRLRGFGKKIGRVAGADLVDAVCAASIGTGKKHYFYGGKPGVADEMAKRLKAKYPGLLVVGTYSPPMREINSSFAIEGEVLEELNAIRASDADFIWIGISSPKQEYWMMKASPIVGKGTYFGVGAAFDFHSGAVERAPRWMRENGLEWLHRLLSEPKRLWRRYLVLVPRFFWCVLLESINRNNKAKSDLGSI